MKTGTKPGSSQVIAIPSERRPAAIVFVEHILPPTEPGS